MDSATVISDLIFSQLNINPETDSVNNSVIRVNGYILVFVGKTLEANVY